MRYQREKILVITDFCVALVAPRSRQSSAGKAHSKWRRVLTVLKSLWENVSETSKRVIWRILVGLLHARETLLSWNFKGQTTFRVASISREMETFWLLIVSCSGNICETQQGFHLVVLSLYVKSSPEKIYFIPLSTFSSFHSLFPFLGLINCLKLTGSQVVKSLWRQSRSTFAHEYLREIVDFCSIVTWFGMNFESNFNPQWNVDRNASLESAIG